MTTINFHTQCPINQPYNPRLVLHHKTCLYFSPTSRKNKIDQERGNRRRKSKSSPLMGMNQFLNDQPALVPSQESSYTREQNTYRSLRRNARGGRSNNVNGGNSRNSRNVRRGRRLSRKGRNYYSHTYQFYAK